MKDNTRFG